MSTDPSLQGIAVPVDLDDFAPELAQAQAEDEQEATVAAAAAAASVLPSPSPPGSVPSSQPRPFRMGAEAQPFYTGVDFLAPEEQEKRRLRAKRFEIDEFVPQARAMGVSNEEYQRIQARKDRFHLADPSSLSSSSHGEASTGAAALAAAGFGSDVSDDAPFPHIFLDDSLQSMPSVIARHDQLQDEEAQRQQQSQQHGHGHGHGRGRGAAGQAGAVQPKRRALRSLEELQGIVAQEIERENSAFDLQAPRRWDTVHLFGSRMLVESHNTKSLLRLFGDYGAMRVEWITDYRCNIVFGESHDARRALAVLSVAHPRDQAAAMRYLTEHGVSVDWAEQDLPFVVWRRAADSSPSSSLSMRIATTLDVRAESIVPSLYYQHNIAYWKKLKLERAAAADRGAEEAVEEQEAGEHDARLPPVSEGSKRSAMQHHRFAGARTEAQGAGAAEAPPGDEQGDGQGGGASTDAGAGAGAVGDELGHELNPVIAEMMARDGRLLEESARRGRGFRSETAGTFARGHDSARAPFLTVPDYVGEPATPASSPAAGATAPASGSFKLSSLSGPRGRGKDTASRFGVGAHGRTAAAAASERRVASGASSHRQEQLMARTKLATQLPSAADGMLEEDAAVLAEHEAAMASSHLAGTGAPRKQITLTGRFGGVGPAPRGVDGRSRESGNWGDEEERRDEQ